MRHSSNALSTSERAVVERDLAKEWGRESALLREERDRGFSKHFCASIVSNKYYSESDSDTDLRAVNTQQVSLKHYFLKRCVSVHILGVEGQARFWNVML